MTTPSAARLVGGWHALSGVVLLLRPITVARAISGSGEVPRPAVLRVLAGRTLLQGVVLLVAPARPVLLAGLALDATHAVSMVGVAVLGKHRRLALVSAGVAAVSAMTQLLAAEPGRRTAYWLKESQEHDQQ